jgi:hypothetical protein
VWYLEVRGVVPPVSQHVIDAGYEDFANRCNQILDVFDEVTRSQSVLFRKVLYSIRATRIRTSTRSRTPPSTAPPEGRPAGRFCGATWADVRRAAGTKE